MAKRKPAPEPVKVPKVLDPEYEDCKLIKREKKKVARKFHWDIPKTMSDASWTAHLLFAVGREEEALAVCDYLDRDKEASPSRQKLWFAIKRVLQLKSHLCRSVGRKADAKLCTTRIEDRGGYLDSMVTDPEESAALEQCRGSLYPGDGYSEKSLRSHETIWRVNLTMALLFVIEIRNHRGLKSKVWEKELEENCERLKELIALA